MKFMIEQKANTVETVVEGLKKSKSAFVVHASTSTVIPKVVRDAANDTSSLQTDIAWRVDYICTNVIAQATTELTQQLEAYKCRLHSTFDELLSFEMSRVVDILSIHT
jgi:hypothetical protein